MNKKQITEALELMSEITGVLSKRLVALEAEMNSKNKSVSERVLWLGERVYDVGVAQKDSLTVHTDGAGSVTLQELASLVIDGKPLKRIKTTVEHKPIEVGAFVPKAEEVEKNPA